MFLGLTPQEREQRSTLNRVMGIGNNINAYFGFPVGYGSTQQPLTVPTRYKVNEDGSISTLEGFSGIQRNKKDEERARALNSKAESEGYEYTNLADAISIANKKNKESIVNLEEKYKNQLSQNQTYNTLAEQIAGITGGAGRIGGGTQYAGGTPYFDEKTGQYVGSGVPQGLSAQQVFGASDLSTKLNFQVSDQQIIDDYNQTKLGRLNRISQDGTSQIAGIQARLDAANKLLDALPAGDARRTSAKVSIDQLKSDLSSVQDAVTKANEQIRTFTPVTPQSDEGLKQITSFREFIKLPEERAGEQLRQIDPEAYRTAVGLGRQYRRMATEQLGATTTPQTEQLRQTVEQEALNQLRLGSTLGAEERRGYEQAIRAAQTARGNIAGLGPAVQEAAQLGAAGEQRKLARYGAAQQFLASGETTGAAAARDLALREGLTQQRLGAAAGFIAGGPSLANLAAQRLGQQNVAAQQYVQANQALPGQFQTGGLPNQFYQTTNPAIPVQLASNAANIYGTMSDYQAKTYGAQVGAIAQSYRSPGQEFASIAGGLGNFTGLFGAPGSNAFFRA